MPVVVLDDLVAWGCLCSVISHGANNIKDSRLETFPTEANKFHCDVVNSTSLSDMHLIKGYLVFLPSGGVGKIRARLGNNRYQVPNR